MPRYLCMQRSLPGGENRKPSPAEMQDMYATFRSWQEKFQENLVDMGGRLGAGRLVTEPAADGPFVELKELVGGYMIVSPQNLHSSITVPRRPPGPPPP